MVYGPTAWHGQPALARSPPAGMMQSMQIDVVLFDGEAAQLIPYAFR